VERRREPRFECIQDAQLADLSTGETLPVTIVNLSGRGMQILLDRAVRVNSAIRIDYADNLILGDICYCHPDKNGFRAGITMAHAISGTLSLAALTRKLTPSDPKRAPVS
jgi:hypothetical protein